MSLFLGLDTSAYTSSLALVDSSGRIRADERILLEVNKGNRGLRQSEALFAHLRNLPFLFDRLTLPPGESLRGIGVSSRPRNVPGSYMPVFVAGLSQARCLSRMTEAPLFELSHQEGHIMAGLQGKASLTGAGRFLAVHFSGGTSEVLQVSRASGGSYFDMALLASGLDLHAGQLVDRVGVALGLSFPAGPELEKLAGQSQNSQIPALPTRVDERGFFFSGPEAAALRMVEAGVAPADIARAVFKAIATTLEKVLTRAAQKSGLRDVLLVGGVMANSLVRERLVQRLEHPAVGMKLHFARPELSSDNAVGVALLAAALAGELDGIDKLQRREKKQHADYQWDGDGPGD